MNDCNHKVLEYYCAMELEDELNNSLVIGTCLRCNTAVSLDRNYELVSNAKTERYFMKSDES